ncbi:hypothetical protein V3C99_014231, partial [Haemonchus contortus]
ICSKRCRCLPFSSLLFFSLIVRYQRLAPIVEQLRLDKANDVLHKPKNKNASS